MRGRSRSGFVLLAISNFVTGVRVERSLLLCYGNNYLLKQKEKDKCGALELGIVWYGSTTIPMIIEAAKLMQQDTIPVAVAPASTCSS